ncbi:MAG: CsgG/HfaB family protein [Gammaproteobacteria bacterium]
MKNLSISVAQTLSAILALFAIAACAYAGPQQELEENVISDHQAPLQDKIGVIELVSGKVTLYLPKHRTPFAARSRVLLRPGSLVQTTADADSRARIVLADGDVIHLGPSTLLGVNRHNSDYVVDLRQGHIIAYAMPTIGARDPLLFVRTTRGVLTLPAGKGYLFARREEVEVVAFESAGRWRRDGLARDIKAGQKIKSVLQGEHIAGIARGLEARLSRWISPELWVEKAGVKLFRNNDLGAARRIFSQLQAAFPYNGSAAYHLGAICLDRGDLPKAISQWRKYMDIDPQGARKKGVSRHLTTLINQRIHEEVQYALANENKLSRSPPEPNSIAVHPFVNKGDARYRAIGKGLTAMVISDIAKIPGIKVLERERIQRLLDEIKLSESGLVSKDKAVRAARLLRAEKIVIGDYAVESRRGLHEESKQE